MQKTDKFSRIVSGTMTWGSWGRDLSKNETIDLMHHCIECGLTTFDHADIYGSYSTEADFGYAFADKQMAMAWSPLGSLFRKKGKKTKRIRRAMKPLMEKYAADESQLLLAWILKHPAKIRPVIGTTNKKRIELSAQAAKMELELEDWFALLVASQGHDAP